MKIRSSLFTACRNSALNSGFPRRKTCLKPSGTPMSGQRYIHLAGTNGKGSTAAFMASVLREAGLKVGLYTSPHLVRFTERFLINGIEMTGTGSPWPDSGDEVRILDGGTPHLF